MRTENINIYTFDELSEEAKEQARSWYRDGQEIAWSDENRQTLEAFIEMLPIKVRNWSYGGRGEGVNWQWYTDYDISELTGPRLIAYLWNNFGRQIYKPAYRKHLKENTETPYNHKRIKSTLLRYGPNKEKYMNAYYSGYKIESCCPFTGDCMDDTILAPLIGYMEKPDGRNFESLIDDSFSAWIKACNDDAEYQQSDEYIDDVIQANDYEFTETGEIA